MKQELRWTPFLVLCSREIRRFLKVLFQTLVTPIINSSLYLLIFGVSLGQHIPIPGEMGYLAFLIPGLVMMSCLNNSYQNSSSSIVSAKFGGELEDYRASPISHQQMIWALAVGGLTRGLIVGLITFGVGQIFYYVSLGQFLMVKHPLWLLYFLIIGGLAFAKLGMSVAFWAKNVDQLSAVSSFILIPLLYLGGVFFSIENLHPFWKSFSQANPLLYFINGVRYGILGISDVPVTISAPVALIALFCFHGIVILSLRKGSFARW